MNAQTRHPEGQYLDLMREILEHGDDRVDRTGVGTRAVFGRQLRFDLSDGTVPILTTKTVYWKTAIKEMLWFLTGDTNIQSLLRQNVRIWTDWPLDRFNRETGAEMSQRDFEDRILEDDAFARQWGDLGPVYGKNWRRWESKGGTEHDQVAAVIAAIKATPFSRRLLFHAWNVPEIERMALPPCHMVYQFFCGGDDSLSLSIYQRSCDYVLGAAFNFVGGAALLHMVSAVTGRRPRDLIWSVGDCHIYLNHLDQARLQLSRAPRPLPTMTLARRPDSIDDFQIGDFLVEGYDPHPPIAAPIAV